MVTADYGSSSSPALSSSSSTRFPLVQSHPVVLAEPPQPPAFDANADLPSVASIALSGDEAAATLPVEHKLLEEDRLASTSVQEAGAPRASKESDEEAVADQRRAREAAAAAAYSYPPPPALDTDDEHALPYPPSTPHLTRAPIEIATRDPAVGRGVFATSDIPAGEVIEISPVLVLGEEEYKGRRKGEENSDGELRGVEASQLRGYVFTWGRDGSMAVALGIGSLFNHSTSPNVTYSLDYTQYTISYRTAKPIQRGEELGIFYGHSVRFSGSADAAAPAVPRNILDDESQSVNDEWGGLGRLGPLETASDTSSTRSGREGGREPSSPGGLARAERLRELKALSPEDLAERDNEIIAPTDPEFRWKKVTELIDPEDADLSLLTCYVIDVPAKVSASVFQFVRRHTGRKFNELAHLKRVRPVQPPTSASSTPEPETIALPQQQNGDAAGASGNPPSPTSSASGSVVGVRSGKSKRIRRPRTGPDALQSVLLFPVSSAPPNLAELLQASPVGQALLPDLLPPLYTVEVPAEAAVTDQQAQEWGKVWPVQVMHIREGAKALRKKKGWEKAKLEWIESQAKKVWERALDAGRRGEHPIACRVTDSWYPGFHTSLRPPVTLVTAHDTRASTGNVLTHAASNAIDAVAYLDCQGARPDASVLSPETAFPPYLLTGLSVFLSHEPCLLCAMSLLHSRIKNLFYIKRAPGAGGCGSLYSVHEDQGLNHRFEVYEWDGGDFEGIGAGLQCELRLDP
ncbi:hypothetical protein JCM10908_001067 [Rhodotorula pacifica]|uniref:Tad3p n=1 Tax=Rhodotorula pacifica TaxID=1495444 RepID=UPI00317DF4B6